jgi:hypothetical protein
MTMLIIIGLLFIGALVAPWVIPNNKVSDNDYDIKNDVS